MHWFDRMSRQLAAAPEARATRRGALKGAAVAAVAAPLVSSDALVYAGNRMEGYAAQADCLKCFANETSEYKQLLADCALRAAYGEGNYAQKKKKKKKPTKPPKKTTPAKAAKETACQASARKHFVNGLNQCKKLNCRSPSTPPTGGGGGVGGGGGGGSACAPGTTLCAGQLCCFGNDACCACQGGYTCCAAVIGCTCC